MVKNCDFMLEILHKHKPFERIRDPDNCGVRVFLREVFLPGHVVITMVLTQADSTCLGSQCTYAKAQCLSTRSSMPGHYLNSSLLLKWVVSGH